VWGGFRRQQCQCALSFFFFFSGTLSQPPPPNHQAVIDQIYYDVTDVEPWLSGNARGPSSAFVLLYRLHTLKPTVLHLRTLITHTDSPYIRAVGFLYLRYAANPRTLWGWCERYVEDEEEFAPSPGGRAVTVGAFVRDLLLSHFYFETLFPRMPKPVADEIEGKLRERGLPTRAAGNGGAGGPDRRGGGPGDGRPQSVKMSLSVAFGQRAPNRAGGARDDHRSRGGERWRDDRRQRSR
jgi:pre-mRNA-splicing factor 38B